MPARESPVERVRAEIDQLFADGRGFLDYQVFEDRRLGDDGLTGWVTDPIHVPLTVFAELRIP